jgi:hypothetical protein
MTRKTVTLTAALAAVVLLIGGYFGAQAWIKAHPKESPYVSSTSVSIRLTDFDTMKLSAIEISGPGEISALRLEREGENWELVYPAGADIKIDQSAVSGKLWSLSSMWAERLVDEAPSNLAEYGLDNPNSRALISDSEGKSAEVIFGNRTPSLSSYYAMLAGDPKVYTVSGYSAESFLFTLNDIRDKNLLTDFDPTTLRRFILESEGRLLDIGPRDPADYKVSNFSSLVINSPYTLKRGVEGSKFDPVLQALQGFRIEDFIDDNPVSLEPYGLDKPGRLYVETSAASLDLLFGRGADGRFFAKLPDAPEVFTVSGLDTVADIKPFMIADTFALIFHIDNVDYFTVTDGSRTLRADIRGTKDEPEFFLNGKKTEDKPFRNYYQAVIGILCDAEYPGPSGVKAEGAPVTVEFYLRDPAGASAAIRLDPYNRDFYSLFQDGVTEFLISRQQVQNIFTVAGEMAYMD